MPLSHRLGSAVDRMHLAEGPVVSALAPGLLRHLCLARLLSIHRRTFADDRPRHLGWDGPFPSRTKRAIAQLGLSLLFRG